MKIAEIVVVILANGDEALFVNGNVVLARHATDLGGESPLYVGKNLASALGVGLRQADMEAPADWNGPWDDIYKLLPPVDSVNTA